MTDRLPCAITGVPEQRSSDLGLRAAAAGAAAANSLKRMTSLLAGELCGWRGDRISVFTMDPGRATCGPAHHPVRGSRGRSALIFVGHGQTDLDDELCLGLVGSRDEPRRRAATSLPGPLVWQGYAQQPCHDEDLHSGLLLGRPASRPSNTLGTPDPPGQGRWNRRVHDGSQQRVRDRVVEQARQSPDLLHQVSADRQGRHPGLPAGLRLRRYSPSCASLPVTSVRACGSQRRQRL